MYDDDPTVFTAMQAGARGYLLKGAEQDEIVAAIRAVVTGQAIFGPGVATRVLGYFASPPTLATELEASRSRSSPTASVRSSACSPRGSGRPRSPRSCTSHRRRSATT